MPSVGGRERGARVTTLNSSGASRVKPSVRAVSPPQPASSSVQATGRSAARAGMRKGSCLMAIP
ncbi:hypothetical protein HMPREF0731_0482 [Pseudoroseomonas cervicalis ATCC 49957]|uniref:Uncharacterized protein n=1 Tax=Pseudoroseomonas cervicalis ATCC 49957 TaxID=525371 RepID=D5RHC3_9PROT|nr:hypothetical protein HMPREF0731_0482 [Pseudoroseomonas cervicalis ATCC 49957]